MIRRILIASAVLASCAIPPALAGDPVSNSYIEARYLNSVIEYDAGQPNPADDEVEGYDAAVSVGLFEYVSFVGSYVAHRYGPGRAEHGLPGNTNGRDGYASAGIGGNTGRSLGREFQVFGAATYEHLEFDRTVGPGLVENSEDGWGVTLGVRYAMPSLDLMTSAKYADYSEYGTAKLTGMTYEIGAALQLTPYWAQTFGGRMRDYEVEPQTGSALNTTHLEWSVGFRRYFVTSVDKWKRKGGIFSFGGE